MACHFFTKISTTYRCYHSISCHTTAYFVSDVIYHHRRQHLSYSKTPQLSTSSKSLHISSIASITSRRPSAGCVLMEVLGRNPCLCSGAQHLHPEARALPWHPAQEASFTASPEAQISTGLPQGLPRGISQPKYLIHKDMFPFITFYKA